MFVKKLIVEKYIVAYLGELATINSGMGNQPGS